MFRKVKNNSFPTHGVKKIIMCKKCYTFYYNRAWHLERPEYLDREYEVDAPVHFTECLACMEQDLASLGDETEPKTVLSGWQN